VDDVVTTGSTLLAAKDSLEKAGNSVVGFLTFAETESKKE
jgi:predicted amidophosphoribosyltransferase